MLEQAHVNALMAARHTDPFSVLGMHTCDSGKICVRTIQPGAQSVQVVDAKTGNTLTTLIRTNIAGFFEGIIPRRQKRFNYLLKIIWESGIESTVVDAYTFGKLLSDKDLEALRDGIHPSPYTVLGAHPLQIEKISGVRFAVWAPNATRVSVIGDFNSWDSRRHPMRLRHCAGVWEIFIPQLACSELYKFEIADAKGLVLPSKSDPYARAAELRPGTASRITEMPSVKKLDSHRAQANRPDAPISIYEVHVASWRKGQSSQFPTWLELTKHLPSYAASLGFTHIQLMPISEHPFDGSWGYQTLGLYAPSARFGPVEDFQLFVDECHAQGLGLLLDWVPAHFPVDEHGLANFDGTALYEYADPREGWHHDWKTLIYNFGRHEVRNFLAGSAKYWIERYGVDGLRVDAVASMLYRDYSRKVGEWLPNINGGRENLEAISLLQRVNTEVGAITGAICVAEESTAFPGVTTPVYDGGLGFHYKWNMGWMNDSLQYMREDPIHRRWHHNKITFSMVYAFSENFVLPLSHDEVVHGKASLLSKMPGDEWQRFANLRAYYGFMWGHPGKKLLFMGQEFAQPSEWNHQQELPWHLIETPTHAGVQNLIRDLNLLYRQQTALHKKDCKAEGFVWLNNDDAEQSSLAWLRCDDAKGYVLVISNFTPVPRSNYRIGIPQEIPHAWREVLNTDSTQYGGSNFGNGECILQTEDTPQHGQQQSLSINLPPLSTIFLVPA
ncbi:MAG TPA: 1,4-alpha-glucan branching protein GlgB [Arenimonas sp.]|nr:1,4-alpha-glucan branching protein GlgB [Arenimonas sp.]